MRFLHSRFRSAKEIISSYTYPEPFHLHLKKHYRTNKKYGSRDRREISDLCYLYWRLSFLEVTEDQRLITAISLFDVDADELNNLIEIEGATPLKDWDTENAKLVPVNLVEDEFRSAYKAKNYAYKPNYWVKEHLGQHRGQLNLPGCEEGNMHVDAKFPYQVQDISSQFMCHQIQVAENDKVWDCCSGSGGKSLNLMAKHHGAFYLTDVRESSLQNAKSRCKQFGYDARFSVYDLANPHAVLTVDNQQLNTDYFDVIVMDAPCSGSGTWFRNPEHFSNFDYERLPAIQRLQVQIIKNAMRHLKPTGSLYYLTCSVFEKENSAVVQMVKEQTILQVMDTWRFNGIEHKGDSMFMTRFMRTVT